MIIERKFTLGNQYFDDTSICNNYSHVWVPDLKRMARLLDDMLSECYIINENKCNSFNTALEMHYPVRMASASANERQKLANKVTKVRHWIIRFTWLQILRNFSFLLLSLSSSHTYNYIYFPMSSLFVLLVYIYLPLFSLHVLAKGFIMDKALNNIHRQLYRRRSLKPRPTSWLGVALLECVHVCMDLCGW